MEKPQWALILEIIKVGKLVLVNPASDAMGERTFSTARRIKTWLRSTMRQIRLNNLAILNIYKEKTDLIDHISILNEFAGGNDSRKKNSGTFTTEYLLHECC